ncbi:tetratricopeptide repeat protein [Sphingomonas sp. AR_OL41]|uniref:SPOR domain-containing protein n=1 Tax=Sphingomonas sp. AR_OL41 TaxID=3042729 RepID=UPI00248127B6|nr:SPOR domain-containing protein [Sphingomonas sp. AR_OL41]MDH7972327.1 tetratricopeptide repeat protein [Sphingomonas sp. AR_OL41]
MKTRAVITVGLSALVLGGMMVASATTHTGIAFASARSESKAEKKALASAHKAQALLAGGKADAAVTFAEAAVSLRPQVADYRIVLGQSYLKAGRFTSARDAFGDALTLSPDNGKAALNLSLAQIATGDWDGARKTLAAHAETIAPSDRGLAMALAGDPTGAVEVLTAAVRAPGADAKARQNLALALALAGRWQEAKAMIAVDVAPAEVDQRVMQWAAFARPKSAYDQVATLLGVTPIEDHGQPVALALNATNPVAVAAADPVDAHMPGQSPLVAEVAAPAPVEVAVAAAPTPAPVAAFSVQFGPRQEIVQALPPRPVRAVAVKAPARPVALAAVAAVPVRPAKPATALAKGDFFVQIGAYDSPAIAQDKWGGIARHFAGHTPFGMNVTSKAGTFYRVSVGGFARGDALSLCSAYRAKGGHCFVRTSVGEQTASWVKGAKALAKR